MPTIERPTVSRSRLKECLRKIDARHEVLVYSRNAGQWQYVDSHPTREIADDVAERLTAETGERYAAVTFRAETDATICEPE